MSPRDSATQTRYRPPEVDGQRFDPFDPVQAGDTYRWLRAAQLDQPVFYLPEQDAWCVTRYADVMEVLRDNITYSSRKVIRFAQLGPEFDGMFPDGPPDRVLVTLDPPDHTRLRSLAQRAFTPKLVTGHTDEITGLCHQLIDSFAADGRCDLVADFADKLPVQVITRLVGAPLDRADAFHRWGVDRAQLLGSAPQLGPQERTELGNRMVAMNAWLREFVEQRRADPQDDLASALVLARGDNDEPALSTSEVVQMIATILTAGSSTTAHFIPMMVRDLLRHPAQWSMVVADPELRRRAVEECLRHVTSVHGVPRTTTRPVTLGGVDIPADADLIVHLAAAQRDPAMFDEPDDLDVHRANVQRHFVFGRGIHTCLGAPLARLEAKIALDTLIERLPGLRPAPDHEDRWMPHMQLPGLERLDLVWDATSAPGERS